MNIQTNLIVLATSPHWSSAISRNFVDSKITWVLDVEQLEKAAFSLQNGAIIVELTDETILECCTKASVIGNNSRHWLMLAVGNPAIIKNGQCSTKTMIRRLGFAFWATSFLEMTELRALFLRHQQRLPQFSGAIEERIRLTLPWTTASQDL